LFGFEFLFGWALLAIPLAGLPVLLHMLYRRKSPIVPFSTLRFIKSSIQRTAARKKVQRWLLLACRVLLLMLLIWAISQPVKRLATDWMGQSNSTVAAIVVDTSYSMMLRDRPIITTTAQQILGDASAAPAAAQSADARMLLVKANDAVAALLRDQLLRARVAIFKSKPPDQPERFELAATIQKNWRPLEPQPASMPLADRVDAAVEALKHEEADQKYLIVISDLQSREFPRAIPELPDCKTILIDLHPAQTRAASITSVQTEPAQPRPGVACSVAVNVAGRANEPRAATLTVSAADNPAVALAQPNLPMAKFSGGGHDTLRTPLALPAQPWLLLNATLQGDDDLAWAGTRTQLVHIPPPAITAIWPSDHANHLADAIARLALDPGEGSRAAWPILMRPAGPTKGDEQLIVANLTQWPASDQSRKMIDFARRGGTLMLFIQPGLDETWAQVAKPDQTSLLELLPSMPRSLSEDGPYRLSIQKPADLLFSDITPPATGKDNQPTVEQYVQTAGGHVTLNRMVGFVPPQDGNVTTILAAAATNAAAQSKSVIHGVLFRKTIGTGQIYVWATLAIPLYTNLPAFELFPPMLVNASLRSQSQSAAANVEIGQRLTLPSQDAPGQTALEMVPPHGTPYQVKISTDATGSRFVSDPTDEPGLYIWKNSADQVVAYGNVQLPSAEADLRYRSAEEVVTAGPAVLVAKSLDDLNQSMQKLSEPEAHWSAPIALVMFLLCLEALMGSMSKLWKPKWPKILGATEAAASTAV